MNQEDLYCKIFVDTDVEKPQLVELIRNIVAGTSELRTILSTHCIIDVCKNDEFDVQKRLDPVDGFLYYRYYLDVDPVAGVERQDYVKAVSQLLMCLRHLGFKAVAACDFEEELPKPE